jgi:hypothetical protein
LPIPPGSFSVTLDGSLLSNPLQIAEVQPETLQESPVLFVVGVDLVLAAPVARWHLVALAVATEEFEDGVLSRRMGDCYPPSSVG